MIYYLLDVRVMSQAKPRHEKHVYFNGIGPWALTREDLGNPRLIGPLHQIDKDFMMTIDPSQRHEPLTGWSADRSDRSGDRPIIEKCYEFSSKLLIDKLG